MRGNDRHRVRNDKELKEAQRDVDSDEGDDEWYDIMESVINGKEPCYRNQKCRVCQKERKVGENSVITDMEGNQIDTSQVCVECYELEVNHMAKFREWGHNIDVFFRVCESCEGFDSTIELATLSGNSAHIGWNYEKKRFFQLCSNCLVNVDLRHPEFLEP